MSEIKITYAVIAILLVATGIAIFLESYTKRSAKGVVIEANSKSEWARVKVGKDTIIVKNKSYQISDTVEIVTYKF